MSDDYESVEVSLNFCSVVGAVEPGLSLLYQDFKATGGVTKGRAVCSPRVLVCSEVLLGSRIVSREGAACALLQDPAELFVCCLQASERRRHCGCLPLHRSLHAHCLLWQASPIGSLRRLRLGGITEVREEPFLWLVPGCGFH
jgi:hypothetical protein